MLIRIPKPLQTIPNPPKQLYARGIDLQEIIKRPRVAIVGSRKPTAYGKAVTATLATELAGQGVVIVSGLAFGVDTIAHTAALKASGLTVAILPTGLGKVYPRSHQQLANQIASQGILLTEYPDDTTPFKGNFIARNRLISGLSDVTVITEAAEHSGSLHTAEFACKQGKRLLVVPGNITSSMSKGTNALLQTGRAAPVTSTEDVLSVLGVSITEVKPVKYSSSDPIEQKIIDLLHQGITENHALLERSKLEVQIFNQTLTTLELSGVIQRIDTGEWNISG